MDWTLMGLIAVPCVLLALVCTVLYLQGRRIDALPRAVWSLAQKERANAESVALAELQGAAEHKATAILGGIRSYHEKLEGILRAEATNADTRARLLNQQMIDAGTVMDTASELVTQLCQLIDNLGAESRARRAPAAQKPVPLGPEPMRSAPILPPEPAQNAAGVGPRPTSSASVRPTTTPRPEPSAREVPKATPPVPVSRKPTLLGIRTPPPVPAIDKTLPSMQAVRPEVDSR